MDWNYYILFWVCIIGLCLGSFYNVIILRSLSNESIVFPPSKCPKCGHKLYAWHNVPVLSYILLGGKCYFCKEKISIQYPIIELVTMILFGFSFWRFGVTLTTLFVFAWLSGLIIMTVTDLKEKVVDCNIAIVMAILGIVYNLIISGINGLMFSLIGLIVGAAAVEIFARLGYIFAKTRAMGEADTYVAGALGAILCVKGILVVLIYSVIASLIFIVPMFLYNKFKQGENLICILSVFFAMSILLYEYRPEIYSMCLLVGIGIFLAVQVLKSINKNEDKLLVPFVPALALGGMFCLFTML